EALRRSAAVDDARQAVAAARELAGLVHAFRRADDVRCAEAAAVAQAEAAAARRDERPQPGERTDSDAGVAVDVAGAREAGVLRAGDGVGAGLLVRSSGTLDRLVDEAAETEAEVGKHPLLRQGHVAAVVFGQGFAGGTVEGDVRAGGGGGVPQAGAVHAAVAARAVVLVRGRHRLAVRAAGGAAGG